MVPNAAPAKSGAHSLRRGNEMNIQWYPGHMTKARREMETDVRIVDMVIELLDARAPYSSGNPEIRRLGQGKERVIVLNKADLADAATTAAWQRAFQADGAHCVAMDARGSGNRKLLMRTIDAAAEAKRERDRKRGILNRPVRAMVAGIPNVGKSTLINMLSGRSSAKTGNKPGVTRGNQWIRFHQSVELLDTPGILWPKFEDPAIGEKIAFLGSINEMIVDKTELAVTLLGFLQANGKLAGAAERYALTGTESPAEMLCRIAERRGCLGAGGAADTEKAAAIVINEFRSGALGRISLEAPTEEKTDGTQNAEG